MTDLSYERLQAMSRATYGVDYPAGLRLATGVNLDPNGVCLQVFGKELANCADELLGSSAGSPGIMGSHALLLDGTSGCWCTTPDTAVLDILGDIDIRIESIGFAGGGINQTIMGKWNTTGNQRSYRIHQAFGLLGIWWSNDGTVENNDGQDFAPAGDRYIRMLLDVVNGVNHTTQSLSAPAGMGLGVTTFANRTTGANTSIFNSTAVLGIGAADGGTANPFKGRVTRMEVRNGLDGTVVANPDFRNLSPGTTSFADASGLTWTLQGTAKIV